MLLAGLQLPQRKYIDGLSTKLQSLNNLWTADQTHIEISKLSPVKSMFSAGAFLFLSAACVFLLLFSLLLAYVNNYSETKNHMIGHKPIECFSPNNRTSQHPRPIYSMQSRQLSHRLCIPTKKHDVHPREVQQLAP